MTTLPSFTQEFRRIAALYPDHAAVIVDGETALTYRALDAAAQSIARRAADGPSETIALAIEKSADYIAALLGCWYAGKVFIPLDPNLPEARRDFILQDAAPGLVVTRARYRNFFPAQNVVLLEDIGEHAFTPAVLSPAAPAYIIYTSGSTGEPKGVIVNHAGIVSMLQAQIAAFGLDAQSRALFYLSISFDASLSDIGTALLSGAALCIEQAGQLQIAAKLPEILARRRITHMDIPPSLLRLLRPEAMPPGLRAVIIGGEACPPETVRAWAARFNVINVYGPTEATICTSLCRCDADLWDRPLLGAPLPGVKYLVLDDGMRETDEGELYIGGAQLAAGYLNRSALTEKKFILHRGQRLYRSGDLVRRLEDGNLEFLGRADRQVKINGQLVELEEIEIRLAQQKNVARCAVIKRPVQGREALVAFVCPQPGAAVSPTYLKAMLSQSLPQWMIPAQFIMLDALPQTPSGKADMAKLRDLLPPAPANDGPAFITRDAQEAALLSAWQSVLKRADIGAEDNFFALGGDSMAVLELSLKAESLGLRLTPSMIADFPTLSLQADLLKTPDHPGADVMEAAALRRDALPGDGPAPPAGPTAPSMTQVFVTGGTGFLGNGLLRQLIATTPARFHVLVRAGNAETALRRLNLPDEMEARVTPVCGDLSLPRFGLADAAWEKLAQEADAILHCGAVVNMVAPYRDLRAANVGGTKEVVELARAGRPKLVHYASTLSVFVSTDQNSGIVYEDDDLRRTQCVYGGYAQTKWAAEVLLREAEVPAAVYRLGLVTGDTRTGKMSAHDFLGMFVRGLLSLGAAPSGPHDAMCFDVTPVDYAARAMAHIAAAQQAGTYHIANTRGFTLQDVLRGLKALGHDVPVLPAQTWREKIERRFAQQRATPAEAAAFMALCRCLPAPFYKRYRAMDLFQATDIAFDMTRTEEALRGTGIQRPEADPALLGLYLRKILSGARY